MAGINSGFFCFLKSASNVLAYKIRIFVYIELFENTAENKTPADYNISRSIDGSSPKDLDKIQLSA